MVEAGKRLIKHLLHIKGDLEALFFVRVNIQALFYV